MFKWEFNGTVYENADPFKLIPIEEDPNYGLPMWQAIGMTETEANQVRLDYQWSFIRAERDRRIAETDWVSGDDVPQALKDKFYTYRQALRDITTQTDPQNIVWPEKPE